VVSTDQYAAGVEITFTGTGFTPTTAVRTDQGHLNFVVDDDTQLRVVAAGQLSGGSTVAFYVDNTARTSDPDTRPDGTQANWLDVGTTPAPLSADVPAARTLCRWRTAPVPSSRCSARSSPSVQWGDPRRRSRGGRQRVASDASTSSTAGADAISSAMRCAPSR
jgi:hypothetical protein